MRIAVLSSFGILSLLCAQVSGQTVTASGGTSGSIPVFTGAATVSDSPLTVSGGNVGVGTATPGYALDVQAGSSQNGLALSLSLFFRGC